MSIIEMNHGNCEYIGFYDMVRLWTNSDFNTPKVKAEVIIDMLISEYIENIFDSEKVQKNLGKDKAVLLAKEFPIKGYVKDQSGNDRETSYKESGLANSPSVDYLVKKGKKLLLVELKTSEDSYNTDQLNKMILTQQEGLSSLFDHYSKVLCSTKSKKKYDYQLKNLLAGIGKSNEIENYDKNDYIKLKDAFSREFDGIEIVYLTLEKCLESLSRKRNIKIEENNENKVIKIKYKSVDFFIIAVDNMEKLGDDNKNRLWGIIRKLLKDLSGEVINNDSKNVIG